MVVVCNLSIAVPFAAVLLDADFRRLETWLILSPFLIAPFVYLFILARKPETRTGSGSSIAMNRPNRPMAYGNACSRCLGLITTDAEGTFCQSCGRAFHFPCLRKSETQNAKTCMECEIHTGWRIAFATRTTAKAE